MIPKEQCPTHTFSTQHNYPAPHLFPPSPHLSQSTPHLFPSFPRRRESTATRKQTHTPAQAQCGNTPNPHTISTQHTPPAPSFPRRRESTAAPLADMDSRLRGNDDYQALLLNKESTRTSSRKFLQQQPQLSVLCSSCICAKQCPEAAICAIKPRICCRQATKKH